MASKFLGEVALEPVEESHGEDEERHGDGTEDAEVAQVPPLAGHWEGGFSVDDSLPVQGALKGNGDRHHGVQQDERAVEAVLLKLLGRKAPHVDEWGHPH